MLDSFIAISKLQILMGKARNLEEWFESLSSTLLWYSQNHKFTSGTSDFDWQGITHQRTKRFEKKERLKNSDEENIFQLIILNQKSQLREVTCWIKYWQFKSKQNFGIKKSNL
jgi:hypothetical protein